MSNAPRAAGARRDWGTSEDQCTVIHVDMDAFFASVEIRDNPALAGKPVIVGGASRSVVLAASYEARAFGVRSAMPMTAARALAPQAIVVPPRHGRYAEISELAMSVLRSVTPVVEQVSVDEAFLDVSGALRRWAGPVAIGRYVRREIAELCGVTCSVGIGASKLVAKLASTHAKPDGMMLVPTAAQLEFLHLLPVGAISGVGGKTQEALARRGVETVGELAAIDPQVLRSWLGVQGPHLHDLAWGRDVRPVVPVRTEKSTGVERTFAHDQRDPQVIDAALVYLVDKAARRLRDGGNDAKAVSLKVRRGDFTTVTRTKTLAYPTAVASSLLEAVRGMWAGVAADVLPVRLLGVRCEGLVNAGDAAVQLTFDDIANDSHETGRLAAGVVDAIRHRFGNAAVGPGTAVGLTEMS